MNEGYARYSGLTSAKAKKQLLQYGENVLQETAKKNPLAVFAGQFKDSMVMILLVSTAISFFLHNYAEAFSIFSIVFLNAIIGFAQEYKTEKTLEKLKEISAPTARVIRDGEEQEIDSREIVPEDLIQLKTGDRVPADAVVITASALTCDESMLTGESLPVEKQPIHTNEPQEKNKIYKGTMITRGYGTAVVEKIGMQTKMGNIASLLLHVPEQETPLQKKLDHLGKNIAFLCVVICIFVVVHGMRKGTPLLEMLISGISLAVAAVPEGLPAVVTICLMISVKRMLNHHALVKKLSAVEVMGCVTVVCTDKTGTLTQNQMTVQEIHTTDFAIQVTGEGRSIHGDFRVGESNVNVKSSAPLKKLIECAVNCNNAQIFQEGRLGQWTTKGEPTEIALLIMAAKSNYNPEQGTTKRIAEQPFDSTTKWMSVLVEDSAGKRTIYAKGAAEVLLKRCRYFVSEKGIQPLTGNIREKVENQLLQMGKKAYRTIGFAYKEQAATLEDGDLIFIGVVGMQDPPRPEVYDAIKQCKTAGIRTVMITGDHKQTAVAVAQELRLMGKRDISMTGEELDKMPDEELMEKLPQIAVFARVSPEHKLRIVRLYKQRGDVVAMTGDGINDAPAIREADIGVAMAEGTEVTREAASVVLLDNNFATLVKATEEGRTIYGNIRKFIRYILTCNIGEVVSVLFGTALGITAIFKPIQLLLINLVTDSLPAISLAFDPKESHVMRRPPRKENGSLFDQGLTTTILFRGCLIGITTLYAYVFFHKRFANDELSQTAALLTLIFSQLIYAFECKTEQGGIFTISFFNNTRLLVAVAISLLVSVLTTIIPTLQQVFSTATLSPIQWLCVLGISIAPPLVCNFTHKIFHKEE